MTKTLGVYKPKGASHLAPMTEWQAYKVRYKTRQKNMEDRVTHLFAVKQAAKMLRRPRTTHWVRPDELYYPDMPNIRDRWKKNWYWKGIDRKRVVYYSILPGRRHEPWYADDDKRR